MAITERTRKLLWGRAADRCAICKTGLTADPLQANDRHAVIGAECHIVARSNNGPRGGDIAAGELDEYDNLILLCATHHKLIDDQPAEFSADRLREVKKTHETWVSTSLTPSPGLEARWIVPQDGIEIRLTTSGTDILNLMSSTLAHEFDPAEPATAEEAKLLGSFLEDLADFGDIYDDIGMANQMAEKFRMTERIAELAAAGFVVYTGKSPHKLEVNGKQQDFPTAVVKIVRTEDALVKPKQEPT